MLNSCLIWRSCQPQIYAKLQPDKIFPFKCDATDLEILQQQVQFSEFFKREYISAGKM